MNLKPCRTMSIVIAIIAMAAMSYAAVGQTWEFDADASVVDLQATTYASCTGVSGPLDSDLAVLVPGMDGDDVTYLVHSLTKISLTSWCGCKARSWALVGLRGVGTGLIRVHAQGYSYVKHRCCVPNGPGCFCPPPPAYHTWAIGDVDFALLALSIAGAPDGAPATIFYRGHGFSFGSHDPESGTDDWTVVGLPATSVDVAGTTLLPLGDLDLPYVPGSKARQWEGSIDSSVGSAVGVTMAGGTWAVIQREPKYDICHERDMEFCGFKYEMTLSINVQVPDDPLTCQGSMQPLFSLDIGSASEPSDPTADGSPEFDPGDMYAWLTSAPDTDGDINDLDLLGAGVFDPAPVVPGFLGAPTCSGAFIGGVATSFFDLDGQASLDFPLSEFLANLPQHANGALLAPIPQFPSVCVRPAENLIISFDDDEESPYTAVTVDGCSAPVASVSSESATYGALDRDDEVLGVTLASLPDGLMPLVYRVADELNVHPALDEAPPDVVAPVPQDDDDDVDALNVRYEGCACSFEYFSADHEAFSILPASGGATAAGIIFQQSTGGPIPVIDPSIHLGLPYGVDIRDFAFAWVEEFPGAGSRVFGLLFVVAPDDPTTGEVESGGLNSRVIYWSALTGVSMPLFDELFELEDDIDALEVTIEPTKPLYVCALAGPANDCCDSPAAVDVGDIVAYDTTLANTDGMPSDEACGLPGKDVWYLLEAPADGLLTVHTCDPGTMYDSTVSIYDVDDSEYDCQDVLNGGGLIGCDDDACGVGGPSMVAVHVRDSRSYLIRVGGYAGGSGPGMLHVEFRPMRTLFYTGPPRPVLLGEASVYAGLSSGYASAASPQLWLAQAFTLPQGIDGAGWHIMRIEATGFTPATSLIEDLGYIIWSRSGMAAPADGDQVALGSVVLAAPQDDENVPGNGLYLHLIDELEIELPPGDYWLTVHGINSTGGATPSTFGWMTHASNGINNLDGLGAPFTWRCTMFPAPGFFAFTSPLLAINPSYGGDPRDLYNTSFRILGEPGALLCVGDIEPVGGDGAVNVIDLLAVIAAWGACGSCSADLNGDGLVNVSDLLSVIAAWGPCP